MFIVAATYFTSAPRPRLQALIKLELCNEWLPKVQHTISESDEAGMIILKNVTDDMRYFVILHSAPLHLRYSMILDILDILDMQVSSSVTLTPSVHGLYRHYLVYIIDIIISQELTY